MTVNKRLSQQLAFMSFRLLTFVVVLILCSILGFIVYNGVGVLSWEFLTEAPEEGMMSGGILPAIIGTLYLVVGSILFAFPVGVMAGVYMVEYKRSSKIIKFIRVMNNNLAAIPSIVFGLLGMTLFVNTLGFGDSIVAGSLTLGLLILPLIIRTTEEALYSVPDSLRNASLALGASRLQTIRRVVLPIAAPNVLTGLILSIGRVSGETAPILFTAAAYFLPHLPKSIFEQVMALPYHLYVLATSGTDVEQSRAMAYGTALVLIAIVFSMNMLATLLRHYLSKKVKMK